MAPRVPSLPPDIPELLFMLGVGSVIWYAAIIALPLLLLVARRIDLETRGRAQVAIGAIIAFIVMLTATAAVDFAVTYRGIASKPQFVDYLPVVLRQQLLPWIAVAATVIAVEARRRGMQSRLERERLRGVVAEQRLVALTGQLQPHFLFNTLQGISTLIHRDPEAADEMLSKLSDLLRDLLKHRDSPVVKLEDELRYVRTYLEISKLRFADRLNFEIDSPSDAAGATVPLFILQPLVENALSHGIGTRARGGSITVRARRESNRLVIEIEDDGNGITDSDSKGIGLKNTRERLNASFGDDGQLTLARRNGSGTVARIDIPYRTIR
jgi:signal transduction histidine kinase